MRLRPLVSDTVAAVRPDIAVVTIVAAGTAPAEPAPQPTGAAPQAQGKTVRVLHDPAGKVRDQLGLTEPDDTAAVLVVDGGGTIISKIQRTVDISEIEPQLARL